MKTCYIFGAKDGIPQNFIKKDGDFIIAADAGYNLVKKLIINPDIVIGDFDSLGFVPEGSQVIKHPIEKDDTDTMLAVKLGFERGFKRFVIYGGVGGRIDHTLANFQTLSYVSSNGGRAFLCGDDFTATAINGGSLSFSENEAGDISVFSAGDECRVTIKGLFYEVENEVLSYDFPLGVSNKFKGEKSEITVHKGTAIVVWQGTTLL